MFLVLGQPRWAALLRQFSAQAGLGLSLVAAWFGSVLPARGALYSSHPQWNVEVIAQAPQLTCPTVVACAPDGRIFVGEDHMDMEGPDTDPIGRVMCIHPGGRITVFADHLWCVFGLVYLDGKLFVNHAPQLSVFKDGGDHGTDRQDVFNYRNERVAMLGTITHIPAGLRLGMDGYLYMAVGDSGLYQAKTHKGETLTMRGGGVVRMRPDISGLEVFATGTRNHPELAMNAEDEMFTYDNTDDGQGWWTRVTHMVDGGYYGYPWEYRPQQPFTLWMMGDYGAGSGTASFAFNEDGFPPEYQGNLFLGDYARSEVLRLQVTRQGATYRIVSRVQVGGLDFLTRGTSDIRPVGIAAGPEGGCLYVADWNTYMSRVKQSFGRLLKLTHNGPERPAPRPAWFAAAGCGKPFEASTASLIEALRHPAQAVRLVAQRRLAERANEALPALTNLVADKSAPPPARWSAIWTLDGMDGGKLGREVIVGALQDPEASLRRQALRQLAKQRASETVPAVLPLLKDPEPSVRFHAATALGRIGQTNAIPALTAALEEPEMFARYADFLALRRIGQTHEQAWNLIAQGLNATNPRIREGTLFAMRETYSVALTRVLAEVVSQTNRTAELRLAGLELLGECTRKTEPWSGEWWGSTAVNAVNQPKPLKTISWDGTPVASQALRSAVADASPQIRRAALAAIERGRDLESAPTLHEMIRQGTDLEFSKAAIRSLGQLKDPNFAELLNHLVKDPQRHAVLVQEAFAAAQKVGDKAVLASMTQLVQSGPALLALQAMGVLGSLRALDAAPAITQRLATADPGMAKTGIKALAALGTPSALEGIGAQLAHPDASVRQAALASLAASKSTAAVPWLLKAASEPSMAAPAKAALMQIPDARALDVYLEALKSAQRDQANSAYAALNKIYRDALPMIEERLRANPALVSQDLLGALRQLGGRSRVLEWYLIGPLAAAGAEGALVTKQFPANPALQDAQGKLLAWRRATGSPLAGRFNVREQSGWSPVQTNQSAYLATAVNVPSVMKVELAIETSSPVILWVNGEKLFAGKGQPSGLEATLQSGANYFLIRQDQLENATNFSLALSPVAPPPQATAVTSSPEIQGAWARNNAGNAASGEAIFNRPTLACARCHRVNGVGGDLGPDLSAVGLKYTREQLVESILYPSRQILVGYQQSNITTKDDQAYSGVIKLEDGQSLTVVDAAGLEHTVAKDTIATRQLSQVSLMPEGLYLGMTREDLADLVSYLEGLRNQTGTNTK